MSDIVTTYEKAEEGQVVVSKEITISETVSLTALKRKQRELEVQVTRLEAAHDRALTKLNAELDEIKKHIAEAEKLGVKDVAEITPTVSGMTNLFNTSFRSLKG